MPARWVCVISGNESDAIEAGLAMTRLEMKILKGQRIWQKIRKRLIRRKGTNRVYFPQRVKQYREMWRAVAEKTGTEFMELSKDTWQISRGNRRTRIVNYQMEFDNPVVLDMAGKKPLMHRLLREAGLRVPDHETFDLERLDVACEFLGRHSRGVVIKPADGSAGLGVTTHVESVNEIRRAAVLASLYGDELLVEEQIPGECFRLLVLDGKMIHAVCRRGVRLRGDGRSTVRELLDERSVGESVSEIRKTVEDRNMSFTLRCQGLEMTSIPAGGQEILIKTIPDEEDSFVELRTVYTDTVTENVCLEVARAVERAAGVLGAEFVGVDLIAPNVSRPLEESGGVINEINTTPALHHHYDAAHEQFPSVAIPVLEALLSRPSSVCEVGAGPASVV